MTTPTGTATPNKSNFQQGEAIIVQVVVTDLPVDTPVSRTFEGEFVDGEGNPFQVSGVITSHSQNPDTLTKNYFRWADTQAEWTQNGLQFTSIA